MAIFEFWRDVSVGSPFDSITRYRYDTSDDSIASDSFNVPTGNLGQIHPSAGTVMYSQCDEPAGTPSSTEYKSTGSSASINKVTSFDPGCCTFDIAVVSVNKTNNSDPLSDNGTIVVTSAGVVDINDYEASIDGGSSWDSAAGGSITFDSLPAGGYTVIVRESASPVCSGSVPITIMNAFTYPPLQVEESSQPDLYSPVFRPITLGFTLLNNTINVKEDVDGTYLEALTTDSAEYLANGGVDGGFPIIKIIDNNDYEGKYQILSRSTPGDPPDVGTKFYIDVEYTSDQTVYFVPFERQVFYLYAEESFNVFIKLSEVSAYPDAASTIGEYKLRLDGQLQAAFKVNPPVNNGPEFTLLKKYYVTPRDFDSPTPPVIYNAVFATVESLTPYLDELIPLGPLPINFINEQTAKGAPVLFSYIDLDLQRVVNITSSQDTDITSTADTIYVPGLPLNQYDVTWINPAGVIAALNVTPVLPAWITTLPSAGDTVKLYIDLTQGYGGDYDPDDYDAADYLTGGANAVVGCYEFLFKDGATDLFTLRICVFPIEKSNDECTDGAFNIAWINLQGGWSSYIFTGGRDYGRDLGSVKTYKDGHTIKRSAVKEVYDTAKVTITGKSVRDLEFIASLRQAIQAFLYDEETQQWSIPILMDARSFEIYHAPFQQIDVRQEIGFRYAEEIRVQTQ